MGVEYVIRDAFTRAKAYQQVLAGRTSKKKAAGQDVVPPRRDLQLEPLVEVLEGKRLVHAHCYRADEILMLIRRRRRDGLQDRDVPARARGLQGREGDCRARRGRVDLLRLVGLQGRGRGRHPLQRRHHDPQGRARLDQFGQRRARAAAEHRGGQVHEVGRPVARTRRSRSSRSIPRSSCASTRGSDRSSRARTPTSSSGIIIRSAHTRSRIASTSTGRSITTVSPKTSA